MNSIIILSILAFIIFLIFLLLILYEQTLKSKITLPKESFTNNSGLPSQSCGSKTLSDCLDSSNCAWCMKNSDTGFDSHCVSAGAGGVPTNDVCDKVYANDVWTRALVSSQNNTDLSIPVFD